jgi:hypothetical protein
MMMMIFLSLLRGFKICCVEHENLVEFRAPDSWERERETCSSSCSSWVWSDDDSRGIEYSTHFFFFSLGALLNYSRW